MNNFTENEHKRYCMIFDMGDTIDGFEFDEFEDAKHHAFMTLINWMGDEKNDWVFDDNGVPNLTEEQIDSWNEMIHTCSVYIVEWDEENDDWQDEDEAWLPSREEEYEIGWLKWHKLKKKYNME